MRDNTNVMNCNHWYERARGDVNVTAETNGAVDRYINLTTTYKTDDAQSECTEETYWVDRVHMYSEEVLQQTGTPDRDWNRRRHEYT